MYPYTFRVQHFIKVFWYHKLCETYLWEFSIFCHSEQMKILTKTFSHRGEKDTEWTFVITRGSVIFQVGYL